jgi:hypothetical protein
MNRLNRFAVKKSFSENNENKNLVNKVFTCGVVKLRLSLPKLFDDWFVGALDSVERNTSNELLSVGIDKTNILLLESNIDVANSHEANGFPVHGGIDFGSDEHDIMYSQPGQSYRTYGCLGVYFDTCGQITKQKDSIFEVIKKLTLLPGSVFGFTFCRSRISNDVYFSDKELFMREIDGLLKSKNLRRVSTDLDLLYSGRELMKNSKESHMNSFVITLGETPNGEKEKEKAKEKEGRKRKLKDAAADNKEKKKKKTKPQKHFKEIVKVVLRSASRVRKF